MVNYDDEIELLEDRYLKFREGFPAFNNDHILELMKINALDDITMNLCSIVLMMDQDRSEKDV